MFKKTAIVATAIVASLMLTPSAALAATVNDEAGFFDNSSQFESELSKLEAERGLEVIVETVPAGEEVNITGLADELRGDNDNAIVVALQDETNKLGVSYGKRITYVISKDSLNKIVDKEMVPLLQEGEYEASVLQLVDSVNFFMGLEEDSSTPAEPGIDGWFAENNLPLAVAGMIFLMLFVSMCFFFSKRTSSKAAELSESLNAEKVRRMKEVQAFWDFTDSNVKERFLKAANKEEREAVISEVFINQTFMDDNARLTNVIGSFLYPGKVLENRSIQSFIDEEAALEKRVAETNELWGSMPAEDKLSFRQASSETHQEALVAKVFPDKNPVELAARFRVMVPDAKNENPDFTTYVDDKLAEKMRQDELNGFGKKKKFKGK